MRKATAIFILSWIAVLAFAASAQVPAAAKCDAALAPANPRHATHERIRQLLKTSLAAETLHAVFTNELTVYEDRLLSILEQNGGQVNPTALKNFYQSLYYPDDLTNPRLQQAEKAVTADNILSVLGDLSNAETLRLYVGSQPGVVAPDSLVGRYLAESGAKTLSRAFSEKIMNRPIQPVQPGQPPAPVPVGKTGPARLVVPIDANTLPIFLKYFSNQQAYSVAGHGNIIFKGKYFHQTSAMKEDDIRLPPVNTPLPYVLLKTSEGQRMQNYITAFQQVKGEPGFGENPRGFDNPARAPWVYIPSTEAGKRYMDQPGFYACCVHWQGNMPIGDKLVTEVVLPGPNEAGVVSHLSPPDFSDARLKPLENVWTYPLHEPVSALLGLAENNGRGEFASSGWVIQSLLVSTALERVPVVFWIAENAKVDLDPNIEPVFENPY